MLKIFQSGNEVLFQDGDWQTWSNRRFNADFEKLAACHQLPSYSKSLVFFEFVLSLINISQIKISEHLQICIIKL